MKQDNNTTLTPAQNIADWWKGLSTIEKVFLAKEHLGLVPESFTNVLISALYNAEHTPLLNEQEDKFILSQDGETLTFEGIRANCFADYEESISQTNETETFFDWCKNSYPYEKAENKPPVQEDKTEDVSVRDKAIEWWENVIGRAKSYELKNKYFAGHASLHPLDIEHIYKSENPVEAEKEDGVGYTGGEWLVNELTMNESAFEIRTDTSKGQNSNGYIATIYCSAYTVPNQAKVNAIRIVKAVNNFDAMKELLEYIVKPYPNVEWVQNTAKALLTNIK